MEHHDSERHLDHRPSGTRDMLLFGLWLRATFVGLALVGAGIAALFDPPTTVSALMALTWIAAGSALGWLAANRVAATLERMDPDGSSAKARQPALRLRGIERAGATS